ncbi:MAG: ribosome silencing factor [Myxococcales bacterium]|jgi:ribosome-associated protein|nr:ribosome silencing factor [Myxococcales bacterium]
MATPKTPSTTSSSSPASPSASASASDAQETARTLARLGLDKKASDVLVLDVRELASYTDFFVLMTAESDPQLFAIADHMEMTLKAQGRRPMSIEGLRAGQWVLLDYGDVVVHVFHADARAFYDIEGLWADAHREEISDEPPASTHTTTAPTGNA